MQKNIRFFARQWKLLAAVSFLFFVEAQGAITLINYPQYFYTFDNSDTSNIKMYAGSTASSCTQDNVNTCNSCASLVTLNSDTACNTKQIYPNLKFTVSIKSDSSTLFTSTNAIYAALGSVQLTPSYDSSLFKAGQQIDVTLTWSQICNAANSGDTSCLKSFAPASLKVGIGQSGTSLSEAVSFTLSYRYVGTSFFQNFGCTSPLTYEGFCFHTMSPGDSKAVISATINANGGGVVANLQDSTSSGSDPSGMSYSGLRVFYMAGDTYTGILPSSNYADLKYDGSSLQSNRITGLTNDQQYVFLTASLDPAGNATFFTNPSDSGLCRGSACLSAPYTNTQTITPKKVVGVLEESKCFVATAAYGSPLESHVVDFREFRDKVLMSSAWGRGFVDFYYLHAESWAEKISVSESRRLIARWALWPIWFTSRVVLQIQDWVAGGVEKPAFEHGKSKTPSEEVKP